MNYRQRIHQQKLRDETAEPILLQKVARLNTPDTHVNAAGVQQHAPSYTPGYISNNHSNHTSTATTSTSSVDAKQNYHHHQQKQPRARFRDKVQLKTNSTEFLNITHRIDPQPPNTGIGLGLGLGTSNFNGNAHGGHTGTGSHHLRKKSSSSLGDALDQEQSAAERLKLATSQSSDRVRIQQQPKPSSSSSLLHHQQQHQHQQKQKRQYHGGGFQHNGRGNHHNNSGQATLTAVRLSVRRRPSGHQKSFDFNFDTPRSEPTPSAVSSGSIAANTASMVIGGTAVRRPSLSNMPTTTTAARAAARGGDNGKAFSFDFPASRDSSRPSSRGSFGSNGLLSPRLAPLGSPKQSPQQQSSGDGRSNGLMAPPSIPRGGGRGTPRGFGRSPSPRVHHQQQHQQQPSNVTMEEWRRIVSAPTIQKPSLVAIGGNSNGNGNGNSISATTSPLSIASSSSPRLSPLGNGHQQQQQQQYNSSQSRLQIAANQALRVGITNRINHRTIPSLNKPLTEAARMAAAARAAQQQQSVKRGRASALRRPRNLFLDCAAVEQEEGIAPPLSCRPDMQASSTNLCSQITNGVFVGSAAVARNSSELRRWGISHVINCVASQCPCAFRDQCQYMSFNMRDNGTEDISKYIYSVLSFIADAHRTGGNVLIHCMRGISRSGSLAIAYVIWKQGLTLEAALRYCKSRRQAINPNATFMFQLSDWSLHRPSVLPDSATHVYRVEPAVKVYQSSGSGSGPSSSNGMGSGSSSSGSSSTTISPSAGPLEGFASPFASATASPTIHQSSGSFESTDDFGSLGSIGGLGNNNVHDKDFSAVDDTDDDTDADVIQREVSLGSALQTHLPLPGSQSRSVAVGDGSLADDDNGNDPGNDHEQQFIPLLVGPLSHFSARMFSSSHNNNDSNSYIVVADGVLFLWQSAVGRPPSAAQILAQQQQQQQQQHQQHQHQQQQQQQQQQRNQSSLMAPSPPRRRGSGQVALSRLPEAKRVAQTKLLLEAGVDLLKKFERCGNRAVQWVDDGAEPPEFWSSFAHLPQRQGVRLTPDLRQRKVLPALQHFEHLNII